MSLSRRPLLSTLALAAALLSPAVQAQTEIQWWHSMPGALGEWVNDLARDFNASQKDVRIVASYKGAARGNARQRSEQILHELNLDEMHERFVY